MCMYQINVQIYKTKINIIKWRNGQFHIIGDFTLHCGQLIEQIDKKKKNQ